MIKESENVVSGQNSGPGLSAVAFLLCTGDRIGGGGETILIISD